LKYDDASWHYGGDFPKDLPNEAGATHTGMFVAWALLSGLSGSVHVEEFPDDISKLRERSLTPGRFFLSICDGKFTDEDLNGEGNAFAEFYFDFEKGRFLDDYAEVLFGSLPSMYHVPDTWESFDKLKPVLDLRLKEWRGAD
jgi:hypothetical protein